jgi:hypothetical protein
VNNHRKRDKSTKPTIKPFRQTLSEVTGVPLSSYNTVRSSRGAGKTDEKFSDLNTRTKHHEKEIREVEINHHTKQLEDTYS